MSALSFKEVIGAVHFDPKKGTVKIQLEATSYVSLDELTTLGPQDESIRITVESEQTRIDELPRGPNTDEPAPTDASGIEEEGAEWLKKAADGLEEQEELHVKGGADAALQDKDPEAADDRGII